MVVPFAAVAGMAELTPAPASGAADFPSGWIDVEAGDFARVDRSPDPVGG
jgi:hypothetical protein